MITFDMNNQNFHEIKSMHWTHQVLLKTITETDIVVSGDGSETADLTIPFCLVPLLGSPKFGVHTLNKPTIVRP